MQFHACIAYFGHFYSLLSFLFHLPLLLNPLSSPEILSSIFLSVLLIKVVYDRAGRGREKVRARENEIISEVFTDHSNLTTTLKKMILCSKHPLRTKKSLENGLVTLPYP